MNLERRLVLFLVVSVLIMWGMPLLMDQMGLLPKRPPRPAVAQGKAEAKAPDGTPKPAASDVASAAKPDDAKSQAPGEPPAGPTLSAPKVEPVEADRLVLGSTSPKSPYHLEVRLTQRGAGVTSLRSSRYEAEIVEGRRRGQPLNLIQSDPDAPASFSLNLVRPTERPDAPADTPAGKEDPALADMGSGREQILLEERDWEVVPDPQGRLVRPVSRPAAKGQPAVVGQAVVFRSEVASVDDKAGVVLTKTYRLWPGEDGLELDLEFASPASPTSVTYQLLGPHGLPIEGEWFTGTFRDVFFGGYVPGGSDQVITKSAQDIVKRRENPDRVTSLPIKYAGVENQYYAVFLQPRPIPTTLEESWIAEAIGVVVHADAAAPQKADVTVSLQSKPLAPAPNRSIRHSYRIFAGPKTAEALTPYGAFELSTYRKGWHLPLIGDLGAQFMSKYLIAPMLARIYNGTKAVGQALGFERGNYGIAIILLTILVRLILFPLGRKQARAAQKMQELQPLLAKLKEECGDDREKFAREQFALFKKHGANPMGGCLPALVQLPVMIGLWQALNNSVALRHSRFLWIDNLAAPDMLFKFPFPLPLIGGWLGPYFNVLPILVVLLMLVQTKLFSPPATTPEQETQQKTMKFMMIFMAFIFYKVPAGLGIYFITSSLWQIGERLLLPKPAAPAPVVAAQARPEKGSPEADGGRPVRPASRPPMPADRPRSANPPAPGKGGWWAEVREKARERMEQIMQDAAKDRTVRNANEPDRNRSRDRDRDRDPNRPRNSGRDKPRNRPGGKP